MGNPADVAEPQVFDYDVQLSGRPPDSLRLAYPGMTVRTTRAQTALRRWVDGPQELDALLYEIGTIGLTLTDVHRVTSVRGRDPVGGSGTEHDATATSDADSAMYEVRVVGELGKPLLRHLGCAHYAVPKMTLVRLRLVAGELHRFLQACTDCGAGLERVRRVGARPQDRIG